MYKIDVPSAVTSMPEIAALGTPGFFTDGDPLEGAPGTVVPADFLNTMMMELINVVVAGSGAPTKGSLTQVRDAIIALIAGKFSFNFASIGHAQLGDIIINWGPISLTDSSGFKDVTFDLPFPNACVISFASPASGPSYPSCWAGTGQNSTTGCRVGMAVTPISGGGAGVPASTGSTAYWFAIGH